MRCAVTPNIFLYIHQSHTHPTSPLFSFWQFMKNISKCFHNVNLRTTIKLSFWNGESFPNFYFANAKFRF